MKDNIGYKFEAELKEVFSELKASFLVGNIRFTDSKEARSIVRATPSDFLLLLPPMSDSGLDGQRVVFFEAKASEVNTTLKKAMLQPQQKGAISVCRLLQLPYIVCFWDATNGVLEFWDGSAVLGEGKVDKTKLLLKVENAGVKSLRKDVVVNAFVSLFKLPSKKETLK